TPARARDRPRRADRIPDRPPTVRHQPQRQHALRARRPGTRNRSRGAAAGCRGPAESRTDPDQPPFERATGARGCPEHAHLVVPVLAVIGAVAIAVLLGALAGLYPAVRAARLAPAAALRSV